MIETDHRTRFAAERRERMRVRLMQSALQLMATHGPMQTSIDDVINHAEVSRGTFYKYFDAPSDLVMAVAMQVSNEMLHVLDPLVLKFDHPAERLAAGIRLMLRLVRSYPVLGGFVTRLGWPHLNHEDHMFYTYVVRDIKLGIRTEHFERMHLDVATNMTAGAVIGAIHTMTTGSAPHNFPEQTAMRILRGLGMSPVEAQRVTSIKLLAPKLPSSSIILSAAESLI
jgi:TetR/AcrR family transcriptional regulator, ethionamide resistance regulator